MLSSCVILLLSTAATAFGHLIGSDSGLGGSDIAINNLGGDIGGIGGIGGGDIGGIGGISGGDIGGIGGIGVGRRIPTVIGGPAVWGGIENEVYVDLRYRWDPIPRDDIRLPVLRRCLPRFIVIEVRDIPHVTIVQIRRQIERRIRAAVIERAGPEFWRQPYDFDIPRIYNWGGNVFVGDVNFGPGWQFNRIGDVGQIRTGGGSSTGDSNIGRFGDGSINQGRLGGVNSLQGNRLIGGGRRILPFDDGSRIIPSGIGNIGGDIDIANAIS